MASVDFADDNTEFAKRNGANFPILSDPGKEMVNAYGVLGEKGFANRWTYYIDTKGTIVMIDKDVNPVSAGASLVRNLEELNIPKK